MSQLAELTRRAGSRRRAGALPRQDGSDSYGRWTLAAILAVMTCQVLFLLVGCDWDFSGDEAEFWAWSRRLDWSYFARGPLIAWLIRLATELFGGLSQHLTGSLMFAARLPAVVLGGLTAWGIFRLGSEALGSRRAGMFAALVLPAIPLFAIGGVLITCDTPLVCCWTWAAVWALRAVRTDELRAWIAAGLVGALGVLAKYSVLALPASVGLFLMLSPQDRRHLARPGFWIMSLLCVGLSMAPILVWNIQHDWVGMGQLADRVGLSRRATWGSLWPVLSFLGAEAAVLGGIWWVVGITAIVAAVRAVLPLSVGSTTPEESRGGGPRGWDRSGTLYLLCLWGVIWSACLAASLLGETEANWMAPGYVAVVALIGGRVEGVLARGGLRARAYVAGWCFSMAAVVAIHHTEWFYPAFARWVPAPTKRYAAPLRLIDVTARMRGHQELARAVQRRVEALRAEGDSPFVLTPTYALASTLEFYLPGNPETYCLSWNYGMSAQPVNQHDLWHPNPRHDAEVFRGRPAVVVEDANMPPSYSMHLTHKGVVDRMDPIERIVVREHGVIVGAWDITVCRDYRGVAGYVQNPPFRPGSRPARQVAGVRPAQRS
ncbi:MAG TPA: glycosyltransferase family 39 protein [Isosphaeraceae bacterium]|nr:glycosyltransferase family 39 protein [Isosphaeraceae bacterium]